MRNKFLFITGIVPGSGNCDVLKLAGCLQKQNTETYLFSPVLPGQERLLDEYEHLNVFSGRFKNLKKALLWGNYAGVVFFSPDALTFYYKQVKSLTESKIIYCGQTMEEERDPGIDVLIHDPEDINGVIEKGQTGKPQLTSIVMLTFNQLKITKDCLKSLEEKTKAPYELIIVDNGSGDGTVDFLKKYKNENALSTRVIYNEENRAFSKANNQGVKISKGDYILLLNNDVILTENWLGSMIFCLESDRKAGAVGPCTNIASGPQKVNPEYGSLDGLEKYATAFRLKNAGRWIDCHRLNAFCFLLKREIIKQVGLLDERFGPGGFEDYDYCLRIRQEGYKIILAGDTYIHHIGGQGYEPNKLNYNELRKINREIFIRKWCRNALEIMETLPGG